MHRCGYYPWIPKILPLVYNDALTYLENVYALIDWCNKLKLEIESSYESLEKLIQQAEKNANDYTDSQLHNFRIEFDVLKEELSDRIEKIIADTEIAIKILTRELEDKIAEFEMKIDEEISGMNEYIQEIYADIGEFKLEISNAVNKANHDITELWIAFNKYRVQTNSYIDFKCEELKGYVDAHTSIRNGNNILVYNPVKATTDTLRNTLVDLYNTNFYGAITAQEYANLDLSAQAYADYNITAWEYAVTARFVFFELIYFDKFYKRLDALMEEFEEYKVSLDEMLKMVNPITGRKEYISQVAELLATYHLNTLTAREYADKNWTAGQYRDLDWTAQYYATSSAGVLGIVVGGEIAVLQYSDNTKDIVNTVMDNMANMPRARPILLTIIASDGYAVGQGFIFDGHGVFMLTNTTDIIRMVYDNGVWTTTRI